ncbi:hypothetical protein P0Y31_02865 [Knoellia sp. 3-2P3]|uniref:MauE/DoxX family redox-associated membrane protein n=1 Tax=unclassified Knoellia TaxID=2618719 RepID=UPI0023DC66EF|nr:MauE/DoxX family redox-associated membrane protein [Knoellia sp. 3-2P3]MDF2091273.1 hypothetical protein [Knoellia sp. 3-2P3]
MSGELAAPFLAASALLVGAGVPKIGDPMPLVRALRSAGLPAGRSLVRGIAATEVALGLWAIARPGALNAALVCAAYLLFTGFVSLALRRGGVLGSCGCFGKADTPPTRSHLAVTAGLAVLGGVVAVAPERAGWSTDPATLVGTLALAALITFLVWQALAVLPTVTPAAVRSTGAALETASTNRR